MAIIRPFKGLRPPKDLVEQVQSRPYDVLDSEEARAEAEGNEKSLYHIIKPEIDFPVGTSEYAPEVYAKASRLTKVNAMTVVMTKGTDGRYFAQVNGIAAKALECSG
jgi:uncharacterized protein (DUF1015 family)